VGSPDCAHHRVGIVGPSGLEQGGELRTICRFIHGVELDRLADLGRMATGPRSPFAWSAALSGLVLPGMVRP